MPLLKEIMTPSVDIVSPYATVADAARKMKELDVGAVPICDGEKLFGMITDRDLVPSGPSHQPRSDVATELECHTRNSITTRTIPNIIRKVDLPV
jgi:CBS domain-containing protein